MKRIPLAVVLIAAVAFTASASARYYTPKRGARCKAHYVHREVRVAKRRHGRIVRRHHRIVLVRQARCEYVAPKPVTKPASPIPTPTTPSALAPTPSAPVVAPSLPAVVRAAIDPSYTQDPTNNLKVTWTYSAGVKDGTLPAGTLSLAVDQPNQAGSSGGCTMNVGAGIYEGTCTVQLPSYGSWDVTVNYTGASTIIAPTTSTETETIEPLPATINETWGADQPTAGPSAQAVVIGSTAAVTVSDPNFEGAQSIGVSDQWGDTCTAPVSGTTASCSMTVGVAPTSFTVAYPGGTSTQSSQAVSPGGEQAVTYQWPAASAQIAHPDVTVQQATMTWCESHSSAGCSSTLPVSVPAGTAMNVDVATTGSLASDPTPLGTVGYAITGPSGTTWTDSNDYAFVQPAGSADCSRVENYAGEAQAACRIVFADPGTYQIALSYTSADANYGNLTGPVVVVDVG